LTHQRRRSELKAKLLELRLVEQAIAIVADAAKEGPPAAELRQGNDRVGHRSAADQAWLAALEAIQETPLLVRLDQAHGASLEAQAGELLVGHLDEDVDDGITQPAQMKFFHEIRGLPSPRLGSDFQR